MPHHKQEEIYKHTTDIVAAMAAGKGRPAGGDAYALADSGTPATKGPALGEGVRVGVQQAGQMLREINFPAFVASLIEGTFHSIVKSSIEQMNAYAEMVKSVAQSLNEFRDENVTHKSLALLYFCTNGDQRGHEFE